MVVGTGTSAKWIRCELTGVGPERKSGQSRKTLEQTLFLNSIQANLYHTMSKGQYYITNLKNAPHEKWCKHQHHHTCTSTFFPPPTKTCGIFSYPLNVSNPHHLPYVRFVNVKVTQINFVAHHTIQICRRRCPMEVATTLLEGVSARWLKVVQLMGPNKTVSNCGVK